VAIFRKAEGAIKLHTLLGIRTAIPVFMHITPTSLHDVYGLDFIDYEKGGYYNMDRGYVDFDRMAIIVKHDSYFVIRSKENISFISVSAEKPEKKNEIICDQRIRLRGPLSLEKFEKELRRIKF
jgi:hypothetical protein